LTDDHGRGGGDENDEKRKRTLHGTHNLFLVFSAPAQSSMRQKNSASAKLSRASSLSLSAISTAASKTNAITCEIKDSMTCRFVLTGSDDHLFGASQPSAGELKSPPVLTDRCAHHLKKKTKNKKEKKKKMMMMIFKTKIQKQENRGRQYRRRNIS
jgi:hypothetical protein